MWSLVIATLSILLATSLSTAVVEPPENGSREIAGRTLQQWVEELQAANDVVRLRAVKTIGVFGEAAMAALKTSLTDPHPGVRYWAAYHLGNLPAVDDAALADALVSLAKDPQHSAVAMAASFALCRHGDLAEHLPKLMARLDDDSRSMACSAAELLGMLGPEAAAAVPALEQAFLKHSATRGSGVDYHVHGACLNALRKIQPNSRPPESTDDQP